MGPVISVIIPVYKVENYLCRCVDSVLMQTYDNFEILLIDDGSPDRSGQICDEYSKLDSRIRVFHKDNGGVSSARNMGLANARGIWISFVDSDDRLEPDFLQRLYADSINVDCVICSHMLSNENGDIFGVIQYDDLIFKNNICELWSFLGKRDVEHYIWNRIYKLDIIRKYNIEFKDLSVGEDTIFNIDYLSKSTSVSLLNYIGYVHYVNNGSLSFGYRSDYLVFYKTYFDILNKIFDMNNSVIKGYYDIVRMRCYYGYIFNIRSKGTPYGFCERIRLIQYNILDNNFVMEFIKTTVIAKKSWRIYRFMLSFRSALVIEIVYGIYYYIIKYIK